ncbi:VRR-NUC domain-containing protein [Candidatus Accumulibacter vicinus]|uniref:VRR-NUC domain-containing protein n=1 Tax=Candidatus Accumulibacter vicinus TaxID=2954382 RepID=A0A084Y2C8_9PROT|nr:VRR-NUC domain-containing protein [Candidatus Accumulibacter vicinus]KFB68872.1 MAG: hypothetical protein CAPSK01_001727 [Candidatus Accumulibacter vicinus]
MLEQAPLESTVEIYLVRRVKALGGKVLKFVSPGNAGVADRLILLPKGVHAFVETKRLGEPLDPLQEKFARDCKALEHGCYRASCVTAVDILLQKLEFELALCGGIDD